MEKILTETDGPTVFEWVNGDFGYPDYIQGIITKISVLKNIPKEEVIKQIYNNFNTLIK